MDVAALRGLVHDLLRDALGRRGRTLRDTEILLDWDHEAVLLRREHIGHEWSGLRAVGTMPVRLRIDVRRGEAAIARAVDGFVGLAVALHRRQAAIAGHLEEEDRQPAWSVLADPLALAIMRHAGWSDAQILRFHRPATGRYTAGDHGYTVGTDLPPSRHGDVSTAVLGLSGGRLSVGRVRLGAPGSATAVYAGGRTCTVEVPVAGLPETVLTSMRGRPLGEVVGHPAIGPDVATITSARLAKPRAGAAVDPGPMVLNLKRRLVPMAPPPEGVDASWLDVIAAA